MLDGSENRSYWYNSLRKMKDKIKVHIIESERGWGRKVDEVMYFDTYEQALKFCRDYNKDNNEKTVPDWYMYAEIVNPPLR